MFFPNPNVIIVRYGEIGLKGANRDYFEQKLLTNIIAKLEIANIKIRKEVGQIIIDLVSPVDIVQILSKLQTVFGIVWFALAFSLKLDINGIENFIKKLATKKLTPSTTFAVRVNRRNKSFAKTSVELEKHLGNIIVDLSGAKVDLKNPNITFHIIIDSKRTLIYTDTTRGPGGLPVGTSGRVLSLLSGGFDSIASSYQLAKRGAQVDFLHFHIFTNHEHVLNTKIKTIADKLTNYTKSQNLYLASYLPFQLKTINLPEKYERYELVVFRRLMHRVAQVLCNQHHYQALTVGDSLGQVASQTMENLVAVDEVCHLPIFRPLIGTDKVDIINQVKSIDLEKEAVAAYKDCCSIVSTNPAIRTNLELIKELEAHLNIDQIVEEIVSGIGKIKLH